MNYYKCLLGFVAFAAFLVLLVMVRVSHGQQPPPMSPFYTQADVKKWPIEPTVANACWQFGADDRFGGRNPRLCEFYEQWLKAPRSNQANSPGYQEYPVDPRPFGLTRDVAKIPLSDGDLMLCGMHTGIGTLKLGYVAGLCWKVKKEDMWSCDLTDPAATVLACVPTENPNG